MTEERKFRSRGEGGGGGGSVVTLREIRSRKEECSWFKSEEPLASKGGEGQGGPDFGCCGFRVATAVRSALLVHYHRDAGGRDAVFECF